MKFAFASVVLAVGLANIATAQQYCPGGNCSVPAQGAVRIQPSVVMPSMQPVMQSQPAGYQWQETKSPGYFSLYYGDTFVGTLHPDDRGFAVCYANGKWSGSCKPPIDPPSTYHRAPASEPIRYGQEVQPWMVQGIKSDERQKECEKGNCYRKNGEEVTERELYQTLLPGHRRGDPSIPDDSTMWRVVIVGTNRTAAVTAFESAELLAWKGRLIINDYAPDAWEVQPEGEGKGYPMLSGSDPTIYLVDAAGKDLRPPFKFTSTAAIVTELKKADGTYVDPNGGDSGGGGKSPGTQPINVTAFVALLMAALAVFLGWKNSQK